MAPAPAAKPPTESTLRAFNGILDPRAAYAWNRAQIFKFLEHVTANGYLYDVPDDRAQCLRRMLDEIRTLCPPDGSMFSSPELQPDQPIARTLNPEWNPSNTSSSSKFLLREFVHNGIPYWSLVDIIGLFLSSIGVAPSGAGTRNFYLPLTAMYAKWCKTLSGPAAPTMFSCVWNEAGQDRGRFFLGASLRGYKHLPTTGAWPSVVQAARFSLINGPEMTMRGWTMNNCPESHLSSRLILFGNCAETYPLLHLLGPTNPATVHGIALSKKGVKGPVYDDQLSGKVWREVRSLCYNCDELVSMWGGNAANFAPSAEASDAPP